jgi:hypothetical protein
MEGYIIGDREIVQKFQIKGPKFREELRIGIGRLSSKLQASVKRDFLSGQALGVRTGRGRRSIEQVVVNEGDKIVGIVSTAVDYMVGWETGWPDAISSSLGSAKAKFAISASAGTFKNGTPKKRAFLAPGLKLLEASGDIKTEMEAAAARALV